jgi:outer membrane protein assembly factor BamB
MKSMLVVLLSFWTIVSTDDDGVRTWTDKTGKFSVKAKLVSNKNGKVALEKENGNLVEVPINQLSDLDRRFLSDLTRQKYATKRSEGDSKASGGQPATQSNGWVSWRGPDRTGVSLEKGLLKSWPENGPAQLWKASNLGAGYSSLVIADGRIFTMGRLEGSQQIICISTDGEVLWNRPISGRGEPHCTPTYDDGLVYALGFHGKLACVKAETGEEVWSVDFASEFGGKMMSQWGFSESPLIDGDRLICTPGGPNAMIVALDKKSGKVIWKTPMANGGSRGKDGAGYSSLVISQGGGTRQYITLVGRGLISVEAQTGRPLWQYERIANGTANVPTPIVDGDFVFCSSGYGDGGSALLQLSKSGRGVDYREVYYYPANEVQNHHGGMVLMNGHVYMGHGHNKGLPMCLELRSGKVKWGGRIRGVGDGSAAIVAADGHVYFRYEDGKMALVEANPNEYKLNGSFRLPVRNGKSWPHPVVFDGKLFIRDQHELVCFDIKQN